MLLLSSPLLTLCSEAGVVNRVCKGFCKFHLSSTLTYRNRPCPRPFPPHVFGGELAQVVSIVPYGAFVNIEGNIDGLVHISEMAMGRVDSAEDVVQVIFSEEMILFFSMEIV